MNRKLKSAWVKALESGRYKQAEEVLRSQQGAYCCLGVLRTIMHPGSKEALVDRDGTCLELLSKAHQKEAGITKRIQNRLSNMNDNGKSFKEIAKWIRARL